MRVASITTERTGFVVAYGFTVLAILNITLLWVQSAASSKRLSQGQSKNLLQSRRVVFVLEAVWVVVLIVPTVLGQAQIAAFLSLPFAIVLTITIAVGRTRMVKLLSNARALHASGSHGPDVDSSPRTAGRTDSTDSASAAGTTSEPKSDGDAAFDVVIHRIRKTTALFIAGACFTAIASTTFAVGSVFVGQRELNRLDNKIHFLVLATELQALGLIAALSPLLWYVLESAKPRTPLKHKLPSPTVSLGSSDNFPSGDAAIAPHTKVGGPL